jgi:DNA polymerase beta
MGILNSKLNNETKYLYKLNSHQLLGVKYFHDMSQKIPREEVQKAENILIAVAKHMNKDIILTLCGSYRRGREKSGDIDCLMSHPDIKTMEDLENSAINILAKFVELLSNLDFIVDHLTDFGKSKYMGFCIIKQTNKNNIARRIDIRFIPFNSYGSSILYFTGSKTFNTQMRTHAIGKGYSLNEYGLKRLANNEFISCKTEEEVFTILNYPYKTPQERDI